TTSPLPSSVSSLSVLSPLPSTLFFFLLIPPPPRSTLFPYTTLFRSVILIQAAGYRRPIRSERSIGLPFGLGLGVLYSVTTISGRSEEHTSELQSLRHLVCRLLLEKKKINQSDIVLCCVTEVLRVWKQ